MRHAGPAAAAALGALLWLHPAAAQLPAVPSTHPRVVDAMDRVAAGEERTIAEQIQLCEIPAPPFLEAARGAEYRRRLQALGLRNVRVDSVGNVIAERPGSADGPVVVLSGHLDTVFPEGTDVRVRRDGAVLRAPGIADDCRGLAVVLAVARALRDARVETLGTLVFVGTVGEEGEGNLRGVRHLFEEELAGEVDYFISVDGTGLNLSRDAVGSYRYTVTYQGPGGHSYGAFGMPSPIHALGRAIAKIADLRVPVDPKVTFTVGTVGGGTSVNSIAYEASMQVDMRSVDPAALDALDERFLAAVHRALAEENDRWSGDVALTVDVERWGLRPAGRQAPDAPIVGAAVRAGQALGFTPSAGASSTDSNIPISLGIPAVTMGGGGRGGSTHALDEWFDTTDSQLGTQWVLLFALALAGVR